MGIPCGFPVTDTGQGRLYMEGKWKPFIPSCMNMLLTTHSATVYTQKSRNGFCYEWYSGRGNGNDLL